ncbi:M56 family metallopeptidase [Hellea sp.]|nr:M56 family metallopeptidase [Hellea sp.]
MMAEILQWALGLGVATTGLIGLVLLLRRPMSRFWGSEAVYFLWALPFLRLFMPDLHLPVKAPVSMPWPADFYWLENFEGAATSPPVETVATAAPPLAQTGMQLPGWPVLIVSLWIIVGAGWISLQLYRHIKYWHLLNDLSSPTNDRVAGLAQKASDIIGLRKLPKIKTAPKDIGPIVSGIFRPLIILPQNFEKIYTQDEQLYALCHEMAHIKRYDLVAALGLLIFRAVNWYNPLVHYAARRFCLDQEAACDAFLLTRFKASDKVGYAQTLLKAERADTKTANTTKPQSLSLALAKETL